MVFQDQCIPAVFVISDLRIQKSFFELEDIIYRIGCEVREGAERELREASAAYKQAMDAYNNAQHQDGGEEEKKLSAPVIEVV